MDYNPATPGTVSPDHVMGGVNSGGDVTGNTVTIENGIVSYVYGGMTNNGDAIGNTVIVNGGAFEAASYGGCIYGGYTYTAGSATGNKVYINGGAGNALLHVYGGIGVVTTSVSPTYAKDNEVHMSDGLVGGITGGCADNCTNNTIYISGGTVNHEVWGGFGSGNPGEVTGNVVYISGGFFGGVYVVGGYSSYGLSVMTDNGVVITGGTIRGSVYGGYDWENASVERNYAIMSDGVVSGDLVGGLSRLGSVAGNSATLSGGDVVGDVIGGETGRGSATENVATVTGGTVGGRVYGGYTADGDAVDNRVEISGTDIRGAVIGGWGTGGDAAGNTTTINGGSARGVYGGYSAGASGGVTGNTVEISGVAVTGGVYGGYNEGGNIIDNVVVINGGSVSSNVFGGFGSGSAGDAIGNTVTISGGSVGGSIVGGYSAGDATGNTVNIIGAPALSGCGIYGGMSFGGGDDVTGNTFNFMGTQTINADSISNFENYNFWLTANTVNLDRLLVVDTQADVGDATVDVLLSGNCLLNPGDKIALIGSAAGVIGTTSNDHCESTYGSLVAYDFSIYTEGAALWAELLSGGATPQSGALTDSRLAGSALLAQGAELASMPEYFEVSRDKKGVYTGFAAVTGGSSTYDVGTGREIDVDSFALMAGVMWDAPLRKNSLWLRAFVEAGWSDYDTDGAYGAKRVRGGGDANYYGIGVHARYQWTDEKISGLYTDASLRIGKIDSDFNTPDIADNSGVKAAYDTDSTYYGAHIGVGHIWRLGDRTRLDLSSKFLWTRIGSDEFAMSTGDRVELGSVNSSRWRTGFRVTRDQSEQLSLFAGAYYEYEFDGDASGKIYGQYHIDKASLSGGTGIGELGLVYRPASNDRLSAMIGVQGYVGAREGFSGRLKLEYSF